MAANGIYGYAGKILRVDLTDERISEHALDAVELKKWVGGVGFGAKYLYEEVPPRVQWNDPDNRLIVASGPLAGTRMGGSGTISICVILVGMPDRLMDRRTGLMSVTLPIETKTIWLASKSSMTLSATVEYSCSHPA